MPQLSPQPREVSSTVLEITSGMVGDNEWLCYADNLIQGIPEREEQLIKFVVSSKPLPITTPEPETDSPVVRPHTAQSDTTMIIIIAVVAVVAVLLVVIITVVVCCRRKRSSGSSYEAGKAERKLVEDSEKSSQQNGKEYGKVNSHADEEVPDVKVDKKNGSVTERLNGSNTPV